MVPKILVISSVLISLTNSHLAPFITPCKSSDEDCITRNTIKSIPLFADGIPDLGVKTLDPLYFENIDSSSPNLKFIQSDLTLKGLKSCKPLKATRNPEKSNIFLKVSCAVNIDGNYEMDGQILVLKIAGKGKIRAFLPNLEISITLEMIEKEKKGQKYWRIKKFTHTFDVKGNSEIVFDGLLQENQVLSQATNELIKNSANDIIKEIGGKVVETALTTITENVNHFFGKVPYNEYSLD